MVKISKKLKIILLGFSFLISNFAFGQGIKRSEKSIDLKVREREKVAIERPGGNGRPRVSRAQIMAGQIKGRLIKGIRRTVGQMKKIISKLPRRDPRRLEIMEKMLNLNVENAAYVTSKEHEKYDERWVAWDTNGRRGKEPKLDDKRSKGLWRRVVRLTGQILKDFPNGPNADEINFTNGLAQQFLGLNQLAAQSFSKLIAKYPNSKAAGNAYFALGDYFFDSKDFQNAKSNFTNALKYKRSSRYGWSLFKLGWCYYNLGDYRKSQSYWKQTVLYAKRKGKEMALLKEEALRDLVYAFAEIGDVNSAISYFNANGGKKYVERFLKLLAVTYVEQGKFRRAILSYKKLQTAIPFSDTAPKAQAEIISLNYELARYDQAWKELANFPKKYSRGSRWASRKGRRIAIETEKSIRDQMLYYAKLSHKNAQERKSSALRSQAVKGYKLFMRTFPRSKQTIEIKYNLADIEYFSKRYTEAGRLYLEIGLLGKSKALIVDENGKPKRNIHKESAAYMLDAYYKAYEPNLLKLIKEKPDPSKKKRAIGVLAQNFIKACGQYVKWYKDPKIIKQCDVYTAEIFYRNNNREQALKYLWNVIKKYPSSKEGKSAVDNIIPLYKSDQKGLRLATERLLRLPQYSRGKLGKKLRDLRTGVREDALVNEKDNMKKARGFVKLARENPRSDNAHKYYFNAAVAFIAAGAIPDAVKAYQIIDKNYANSAIAENTLLDLAKIAEKRVNFSEAIKYYNKYAIKYPKSKSAPGAAQKVCNLTIAIKPDLALANCKRLEVFNKAAYMDSLQNLIVALYSRQQFTEMDNVIINYLKLPGLTDNQRISVIFKRHTVIRKKTPSSNKYSEEIIDLYNKNRSGVSGASLRYVAEILFQKYEPSAKRFFQMKIIGGTVEKMQASIVAKSNELTKIEQTFGKVTTIGEPLWGSAALYKVASAYEDLGKQLSNPPGIKGAKIEDIKKQLAGSARQALDKAAELYKAGYENARKFGAYSKYTVLLSSAIARNAGSKLTFSDWVLMPDFIGSEVSNRVSIRLQ